jgi:hypothetical protein
VSARESDALHERVRAFVRENPPGSSGNDAAFDALAVEIARFQARHIAGAARLRDARGREPSSASEIPAVPVAAFRMTRVAVHPPEQDIVVFRTSGTTDAATGLHPMRTTQTYRELSLAYGSYALAPDQKRRTVVALAPHPGEPARSSLGWMMRAFMDAFDGRPLGEGRNPFMAGPDGIDVEALKMAAGTAARRGEPLLVLATGFALVLLTDALGGARIECPSQTVVMPTGGFKARTREVTSSELVSLTSAAFGIDEARVVGEYGMTELTSQLYEGTLPDGKLRAARGVFVPPPWLRVTPVDPVSLEPVGPGEVGIARFVDLGNVDSAVAIVTEDRIRTKGSGVELLGRLPGAEARGCSLAIEQMVLGSTRGTR